MKRFIFGAVLCFSLFSMVGNAHACDKRPGKFKTRLTQIFRIVTNPATLPEIIAHEIKQAK